MTSLLQIRCDCGKTFQVPNWRCNQEGICSACNATITIPSVYYPEIYEVTHIENEIAQPTHEESTFEQTLEKPAAVQREEEFTFQQTTQRKSPFHKEEHLTFQQTTQRKSPFHEAHQEESGFIADDEEGFIPDTATPKKQKKRFILTYISVSFAATLLGVISGILLGPTYFEVIKPGILPKSFIEPVKNSSIASKVRIKLAKLLVGEKKPIEKPVSVVKNQIKRPHNIPDSWYFSIKKNVIRIEELLKNKTYKTDGKKSKKGIKTKQYIALSLKCIQEIKNFEIKSVALFSHIEDKLKGKDMLKWFQNEKKKIKRIQQLKEFKILKNFIQFGSVFPTRINDKLPKHIPRLKSVLAKKKLTLKVIGRIHFVLRKKSITFQKQIKTLTNIVNKFIR